jgi:ketosteroid isomerase-like protein
MDNTDIAKTLFAAFAEGDAETVRSFCGAGFRARQNGGDPMDLDALLGFSAAVNSVVPDLRYDNPVRAVTPTGFVEEHNVRGTLVDGTALDLAVCVVGEVSDGKIISLREYFNAVDAAAVVKALGDG